MNKFAFFTEFGAFVLRFVGQLYMKMRVVRREGFGGSAGEGSGVKLHRSPTVHIVLVHHNVAAHGIG